jgi:hypothetical protein
LIHPDLQQTDRPHLARFGQSLLACSASHSIGKE